MFLNITKGSEHNAKPIFADIEIYAKPFKLWCQTLNKYWPKEKDLECFHAPFPWLTMVPVRCSFETGCDKWAYFASYHHELKKQTGSCDKQTRRGVSIFILENSFYLQFPNMSPKSWEDGEESSQAKPNLMESLVPKQCIK